LHGGKGNSCGKIEEFLQLVFGKKGRPKYWSLKEAIVAMCGKFWEL